MSYLDHVERSFYGINDKRFPGRGDQRNEVETRRRQRNYEERKRQQQMEEEEYRRRVLGERHRRIQEITEKYQRGTYVKRRPQTSPKLVHLKSIYCQRMLGQPGDKSAKYDVHRISSAGSDRETFSPIARVQEDIANGLRRTEWREGRMEQKAVPPDCANAFPPRDTRDILREIQSRDPQPDACFVSPSPFSQAVFGRAPEAKISPLLTRPTEDPPTVRPKSSRPPRSPVPQPLPSREEPGLVSKWPAPNIADNSFLTARLHLPASSPPQPRGILKKSPTPLGKTKSVVFDSIEVTKIRSKSTTDLKKCVRFSDQQPPSAPPESFPESPGKLPKPESFPESPGKVPKPESFPESPGKVPEPSRPPPYKKIPLIVEKRCLPPQMMVNPTLPAPIEIDGSVLANVRPTQGTFTRDRRPTSTVYGKMSPPNPSQCAPQKANSRITSLPTLDSLSIFAAAEKYANYDLSASLMNRLLSHVSRPNHPSMLSMEENRLLNSLDKLDERLKDLHKI